MSDQLGGLINSKHTHNPGRDQELQFHPIAEHPTPFRAELSGGRHCSALGIAVDAYTPVLTLARRLIYAGLPSDCVLEVYRGATLCFRVPLAVAARLTVEDSMNGAPRFRRYRPPSWEVGPPIAPNGRALPGEPSSKNNAPLASLTEGGTR